MEPRRPVDAEEKLQAQNEELRTANRLLMEAQEQLRKLSRAVEQSPASVIITNTRGAIEYVNPKFTQVTGYAPEEVMGQNPRILKSGETSPGEYGQLWETITSGGEWRGEFHNRKKNGELYWEYASISPIRNADGAITHFVAVKEDITERKRAEMERERLLAQVETERARLEAVLRQMPAGVIIAEAPSGKLLLSNEQVEQILRRRFSRETNARQSQLFEAFHGPGQPYTAEEWPLALSMTTGAVVVGEELDILRGDGTCGRIRISSAPIRDREKRIIAGVATFYDVTELHLAQRQREEMLHLIAHDLRQPLTITRGHVQFLRRNLERGDLERTKVSVQAIEVSTRRLEAMIRDLVESARLEAGQMPLELQPLDLEEFARETLLRLSAALDVSQVRVEVAEPVAVNADPDQLERILGNLISNALKYCEPGTDVTVRLEKRGEEALVSVSDRGPGIAPQDLPRLFERGFRATRARKVEGLGLGLYIVRLLVEAHGGQIRAESEPGRGTTFEFTLPLVR